MYTEQTPPRILIIDDEPNVRLVLARALQHEGYRIDTASGGQEAIRLLSTAVPPYDLLLLDLKMEPVDGLEVLRRARQQDPDLSIIILTAHSSLESAVEALRLGAFDYLFKPVKPETVRRRVKDGLVARQQAVKKRRLLEQVEALRQTLDTLTGTTLPAVPPDSAPRFVRSGGLIIDRLHRQVTFQGQLLELTTAEFDLLLHLVLAAPRPVPPLELAQTALGYTCTEQEARDLVKWHIHHLRRKIEPDPARPSCIKTVRHRGYLWAGGD
ncbi:MAG: DNA-binding response regulator [Chloroflexi bacterium]|nr:MAG: DNA-binding response regulator [Chloroflexota bacterium]